jgi:hypothetical protein
MTFSIICNNGGSSCIVNLSFPHLFAQHNTTTMSDHSSNTTNPAPPKRARGSSEETTLTPSHDDSQQSSGQSSLVMPLPQQPSHHPPPPPLTSTSASQSASSILESARLYHREALSRHNEARSRLAFAKEDAASAMEAVKRSHDRLRHAEQCVVSTSQSVQRAREYLKHWEEQFPHLKSTSSTLEQEDVAKHVSFAPQHNEEEAESLVGSRSASNSKIRRKRIRVMEHGWGTYEGCLDSVTGEPTGRGTVTWENGGKYSGDWLEGKAHGHGVMDYW